MYGDDPRKGPLQGDIVRDVHFSYFEQGNAQLLMQNGGILPANLLDSSPPGDCAAIVPIHRANGIVVSQDCDLTDQAKTQFLLLARVWPIDAPVPGCVECGKKGPEVTANCPCRPMVPGHVEASKKGPEGTTKWLNRNLLSLGPYVPFFYLMEHEGTDLPVSVADLRDIHPVPRPDWPGLAGKRILRLTVHAKQVLQARLAHFFGRIAVDQPHFLTAEQQETLAPERGEGKS